MVLRRLLLWLLLFALLAAQTLGLLHRVAHAPDFAAQSQVAAWHVQASDDKPQGWMQSLFGAHGDESGCLLFDQLSHGGCLPSVAAVVLTAAISYFFIAWFQGEALALWAAFFDARGPPSLR